MVTMEMGTRGRGDNGDGDMVTMETGYADDLMTAGIKHWHTSAHSMGFHGDHLLLVATTEHGGASTADRQDATRPRLTLTTQHI